MKLLQETFDKILALAEGRAGCIRKRKFTEPPPTQSICKGTLHNYTCPYCRFIHRHVPLIPGEYDFEIVSFHEDDWTGFNVDIIELKKMLTKRFMDAAKKEKERLRSYLN